MYIWITPLMFLLCSLSSSLFLTSHIDNNEEVVGEEVMEDEDTEEDQHEQALEREEKEHGDFFELQ